MNTTVITAVTVDIDSTFLTIIANLLPLDFCAYASAALADND